MEEQTVIDTTDNAEPAAVETKAKAEEPVAEAVAEEAPKEE